ncbi:3-phosphoshikimate 1-carboxyvinyltransferase [Aciduricibacillus chroicocephali]|uniref:3-phosphoshikimate 1-carboxyvinyltransferase n=1 Tax=Aciduricibacillus chroicocephali TaxID=3054939 RepID=A0ABY9KSE7_9BACI|nr:3-phosphoshikimate 1-carboxyvinyltransferase [Bacillaceae bacterium 44XB]
MGELSLAPAKRPLKGNIEIPGDKSISHRSVIFGSLAKGTTKIENFLDGEDCLRTIHAFQAMGVEIEVDGTNVVVNSKGIDGLNEPLVPLYFGNSGTTARLMLGVLAGLPFFSMAYGDPYLTKRPMDRVVNPLRQMGAQFDGREGGSYLPISIRGKQLHSITYEMPLKSAQVKSAVLLAGLLADGETTVIEKTPTRDHTENMLRAFGADLTVAGEEIRITNKYRLVATDVVVPGDISSAAFYLAAAAIVPGSELTLKRVGLNKTRTGILDVLEQMGADLSIDNVNETGGEKFGDITVRYSKLKGIVIEGDMIPRLIDEIPIIALIASQAEGETIVRDAEELRVKETDRIAAVEDVLGTLGASISPTEDGMAIKGETPLKGGLVRSYHDHRIAMMAAIASFVSEGAVVIDDISSIQISYPTFFEHFHSIQE